MALPSSQDSMPPTKPLPQRGQRQLGSQPSSSSLLSWLLSLYFFVFVVMSLPQALVVQLVSQPSPFVPLPSSHSSPSVRLSMAASPQRGTLQSVRQEAFGRSEVRVYRPRRRPDVAGGSAPSIRRPICFELGA